MSFQIDSGGRLSTTYICVDIEKINGWNLTRQELALHLISLDSNM